ncbi:MAG: LysR family transcriptional regulator [Eubacterium sp.]|nr:LysR family transcriptional regulator [Eubacterium sp.]
MTLTQLKYLIAVSEANSLNDAAKALYISQPSLSAAIRSLEKELGFDLLIRTKGGITMTVRGLEFLGYAKSVMEQYALLDARFISQTAVKKRFSVSMQHYTFAVDAFAELVKRHGMDEYEFEVHETKTYEVIENVKNQKSELGVLYLNDYNKRVMTKIFGEAGLRFEPFFDCGIYVYLWKGHPLANRDQLSLEDLEEYPCLSFDQGTHNSFYFAEEVLSTYPYKRLIKASDRATLLNLMVRLQGYTLCCGIICEDLNGPDYLAVRLVSEERMTIGCISRKDAPLSSLGQEYLEYLSAYREKTLN